MSETLTLKTEILDWAARSAGTDLLTVARGISEKSYEKIAQGYLTFAQVKNFAKKTRKPLGFLFLDTPPQELKINLPDLRTRDRSVPFSENFIETYKDIVFKQDWYKDYLIEIGAPELDFVGSFSIDDDIKQIAENIRKTLNIYPLLEKNIDFDEYHKKIAKSAEQAGILVFRNSIVNSNTHRSLDSSEFLGFAIADKIAPVIFINGADKTPAKNFTLAHELAHIWLGESGIIDNAINTKNKIEAKCNAIAAEVLVPADDFLSAWEKVKGSLQEKYSELARNFHVSALVIARVALEQRKIKENEYMTFHQSVKNYFDKKPKPEGGNGNAIAKFRNSEKLTALVQSLIKTGDISFKEAGLLLNKSPMKVGL